MHPHCDFTCLQLGIPGKDMLALSFGGIPCYAVQAEAVQGTAMQLRRPVQANVCMPFHFVASHAMQCRLEKCVGTPCNCVILCKAMCA